MRRSGWIVVLVALVGLVGAAPAGAMADRTKADAELEVQFGIAFTLGVGWGGVRASCQRSSIKGTWACEARWRMDPGDGATQVRCYNPLVWDMPDEIRWDDAATTCRVRDRRTRVRH